MYVSSVFTFFFYILVLCCNLLVCRGFGQISMPSDVLCFSRRKIHKNLVTCQDLNFVQITTTKYWRGIYCKKKKEKFLLPPLSLFRNNVSPPFDHILCWHVIYCTPPPPSSLYSSFKGEVHRCSIISVMKVPSEWNQTKKTHVKIFFRSDTVAVQNVQLYGWWRHWVRKDILPI